MSIRLPRLLNADRTERARLSPIHLSLDLRLRPLSTAELLLPSDSPDVSVRDLIELYDEHGSAGIFRVCGVDEQPGMTRHIYLEHGLISLSDGIIPPMSYSGTVRGAFERILGYQPDVRWTLGETGEAGDMTVLFSCGYENLLTALLNLMELLPQELMLEFDQSQPVWVVHLRPLSDEDACEGRLHRNLSSVRIEMDGSDLCTRVYPLGAGEGTDRLTLRPLTGQDYLDSAAISTWGVICRSFASPRIYDVPTLRDVAVRYLERHSEPTVSVTAAAIDLSAATGEAADSFRLGRMCRLALPEHGAVLHERVVAIRKNDVYGAPGEVTLTLNNRLSDASDEIADMLREVTASKLIGGQVTDVTTHNRASGTATSRIEHYFRVESWAAVLACMVSLDPDDGVDVVNVKMDNNAIPADVWGRSSFDALPYMARDDLGQVTTGRHTLAIYPDSGDVGSTVTLKVIQHA